MCASVARPTHDPCRPKWVTNSPSHSTGFFIASFTSGVTNSHSGNTSLSIRWTRRNGCGEHTEARRLKPQLRMARSSNKGNLSKLSSGPQPERPHVSLAAATGGGNLDEVENEKLFVCLMKSRRSCRSGKTPRHQASRQHPHVMVA